MSDKNPSSKPSRMSAPSAPVADGEEDFAALFEASQQQASSGKAAKAKPIAAGDLITCQVIAIGQSSVFVSVGEKAEGTIDVAEFRDPATSEITVAVGDRIKASVIDDGGKSGTPVLTCMLGRSGHAAAELEQALALGVPVEGMVTGENKGGYDVQFGSVRAFCPGSQIDLRRGGQRTEASEYVGRRLAFRILKVENDGRNVVVSRRDLLEEEAAQEAEKTWEKIQVGAVLEGTVRSLREFGAFVDLGGVDGMVHVSEMSFTRIRHPKEVVNVGDRVRVQVLRISDTTGKDGRRQIALSIKALAEDPWTTLSSTCPVGSVVSGTVTRVEAYGAFVEIQPGLEGLVHISKMSLDRRLNHGRQGATVGQDVEVTVLAIDAQERRVSLSMVEKARLERDAGEAVDRREQDRVLAEHQDTGSLGTFADLLEEARNK